MLLTVIILSISGAGDTQLKPFRGRPFALGGVEGRRGSRRHLENRKIEQKKGIKAKLRAAIAYLFR